MTIFEDVIIKNGTVIIPESLRQDILAKAHSTHQGIVRTKQFLRIAVYWPGMSSDIEEICKNCRICRQLLPQEELPLSPVERPEGPWIQIGIDIFSFDFDHYLTIHDYYSKWPEVYKLKETTTTTVIACIKDCFLRFGNPPKLLSDNGPQFSSFAFCQFLEKINVEHVSCAPLHAQSNGQIERFHRYLNHTLRSSQLQGFVIRERFPEILQILCATSHAATGRTPAYLLQNREITTDFPTLRFKASDKDHEKYQAYMKNTHDKKLKTPAPTLSQFKVGDLVWSLAPPLTKSGPIFPDIVWVVIGIKGERKYQIVNSATGNKVIRIASYLRHVSFNTACIRKQIEPTQNAQQLISPITTASISDHKKSIDEVSNKQSIDEPLLSSPVDPTSVEADVQTVIPSAKQPIRRSTRNKRKPTHLNDYVQ